MNLSKKKWVPLLFTGVLLSSLITMAPAGYAVPNHAAKPAQSNAANRVTDLEVSEEALSLSLGENRQLDALVTYSNNSTNTQVSWVSMDEALVTVSEEGVVQASETMTGSTTLTATASRGQSELTVDIPVTVYDDTESSIADARMQIGETVTVQGTVSVDNNKLQADRLNVYIQDAVAGIQLFNFNADQFPDLKEGDLVEATGEVGVHSGVTQLTVSDVIVLAENQPVTPKFVTISDLSDEDLAESLQGQLVTFEGFIQTVPTYYFGGANISAIDDEFNTLLMRAWESTGIVLEDIEAGNWFELTGILSKYNDSVQLLPRQQTDITLQTEQKDEPSTNQREFEVTVDRVVDGDTIRIVEPVFGATNVRFLNMDTAETYHAIRNDLDQHQMDQGIRAGQYLQNYLSDGDRVILRLGEEPLDAFGRLLAEVITLDGVNTNLELVRAGEAITYFIYPFESDTVGKYVEAAEEAYTNQVGMYDPADPLLEEPNVFRARERGDSGLSRFVGHALTNEYVEPNQYAIIPSRYRVFFRESEAIALGYEKKSLSNEELAYVDKNEARLNVLANNNIARLTEDMTLPTTARYGSTIEWESSDTDVVSHDGVINKTLEEKTDATLTATITNGEATQVLTIDVTVLEPIISLVGWTFENQAATPDSNTEANANRAISRETAITPTFPQGSGGSGTAAYNTNNWQDGAYEKYYQIDFETIGFRNITLSSRQLGSNTGPRDFKLQYSLDGSSWVDVVSEITVSGNWNGAVVDNVQLPVEADNQETVYVRWLNTSDVSINGGTVSSGGTSRIDDILVTGNPSPLSDELSVQLDADNLGVIYQGEDAAESVTQDVLFLDRGVNGSDISWTSSKPEVVSTDGTVNRPESGEVEVSLTATISKGAETQSRTFTLLVKGEDSMPAEEVSPLIGYFNFNTSGFSNVLTSGESIKANEGAAVLRTNFANISEFQGTTMNALADDADGNSLSLVSNINNGNHVELEFSAAELSDINLSFATRGTGTGFTQHQWSYSLDGLEFTDFGENTANTTATWQLKELSLPSDVNGQDTVFVRLTVDGATGTSGNNRIDNLQIKGTVSE